jgi:hypothetical protein
LHFRATETRKNMSNRKAAVPLPILDPKASAARDYPVWALEEWQKKHRLYAPKEALRRKGVRCGAPGDPVTDHEEAAKAFRTFPKYLQHLCTECRGEGQVNDPAIVGCRIYACEVWPYRFGKNPSRKGLGNRKALPPKPRTHGE